MNNHIVNKKVKEEVYIAGEYMAKGLAALYRSVEENEEYDDYLAANGLKNDHKMLPECSFDIKNNVTCIKINNIPPILRKDISDVRSMWIHSITKALKIMMKSDKNIQKYEKAFVIIKYYVPASHALFDNDNRTNKYIIDGIRYSLIINDDNFEHLSYAVLAIKEVTCPKTVVYIINHSDLDSHISLFR